MASLKDRTGYGDSSQGSHDVEFLDSALQAEPGPQ